MEGKNLRYGQAFSMPTVAASSVHVYFSSPSFTKKNRTEYWSFPSSDIRYYKGIYKRI